MITLDQGGAARHSIRLIEPGEGQRSYVRLIWVDVGSAQSSSWRIVADDAPHIVYSRYAAPGSNASRLHLVGARSSFVDIDNTRRLMTIGIRLQPGLLPAFAGVSASRLTDQTLPLDSFVPRATRLRQSFDALDETPSDRAITSLVAGVVGTPPQPHPRVELLERMNSVSAAATAAGVTERALYDWSHQHLGLSPRRYLRIRRLHHALSLRFRDHRLTWSAVAARAGYADQSHCVRDCRDFLGESPAAFAARGTG